MSKTTPKAKREEILRKPTTQKSKTETSGRLVLGEYFDRKLRESRPVTMTTLLMIADKLHQWADLDDSLAIMDFIAEMGMNDTSYYVWKDRCPEFAEEHDYAMARIGARRETGCIRKKYDTGAVWKMQYQYGKQYREAMEFAAKLAKKEDTVDGGSHTFNINVTEMRSDPSMEKHFKAVKAKVSDAD